MQQKQPCYLLSASVIQVKVSISFLQMYPPEGDLWKHVPGSAGILAHIQYGLITPL